MCIMLNIYVNFHCAFSSIVQHEEILLYTFYSNADIHLFKYFMQMLLARQSNFDCDI